MIVIDTHVDDTRITELVMDGQVPHIDGTGIQMDGVGEGIIRIRIFDAQPAVQHIRISLDSQRLERTVQVDVSETPSFHIFSHLFHKGVEESQIDIVGSEE